MNCISCGANVKKINKAKRCKKCEDKRKVIIEKVKELIKKLEGVVE